MKTACGAGDQRYYGSVTIRIDQDCHSPVSRISFDRGIQAHRNFTYYGLRQSKNGWQSGQFEVTEQSSSGSFLSTIDSGSEKPKLGHKDFGLNQPDVQGEE